MSYTGGDASLHRHSIPNQLERYHEFDLGAQEQKALAGLVKGEDTLDMALLYGQPYGRDPTKSSSPMLSSPMWNLRISPADIKNAPEDLGAVYDKLVLMLGEETKAKLLSELAKPFGERDIQFTALQGLLETTAIFIVTLERANQEIDPTSLTAENRLEYQELPLNALTNLDNLSQDVLTLSRAYLQGEH